ncbi:MAG: hypothetical protein A2X64_00015 [Ignavibacteria bacterium GWF2_33_9]|nr:MAG: hypothetical protein A2X64_00015 [Ignavibacteria bacterium GWF2_33_9]
MNFAHNLINLSELKNYNQIINHYYPEILKIVKNTINNKNIKIRTKISDFTGLSLVNKSYDKNEEISQKENYIYDGISQKEKDKVENYGNRIQIEVVSVVPFEIKNIIDRLDIEIFKLILRYKTLKKVKAELEKESSNLLSEKYISNDDILRNSHSIRETIEYYDFLINLVNETNIKQEIEKLKFHLLGSFNPLENKVYINWFGILLASIFYEGSVEDFTIMSLIHELSHAYTKIGFDKDGNHWINETFENSDIKIKEGFAQQYCELIIESNFEELMKLFIDFSINESRLYIEYRTWFDAKEKHKVEKVRSLLIQTRTQQITSYNEFIILLENTKKYYKK